MQPQNGPFPEAPKKDFAAIDVETKNVTVGQLAISMPVFHHPNPRVAAALAEMFNTDASVKDNTCGWSNVSVVSANTGLLSVVTTTWEYACVDPEAVALAARGMGGAPAGPRVRGTVFVIDGDHVLPVSFGEIVASPGRAGPALRRYCEKEIAAPDEVVKRHDGYCTFCGELEKIGLEKIGEGGWSFGVDEEAVHLFLSETTCDLIVPYVDIAPWLATDAPVLRILHAPAISDE